MIVLSSRIRWVDTVYGTVPCPTIQYRTLPCCSAVPCRAVPYNAVVYRAVPHRTVPYGTILYHAVPCHCMVWNVWEEGYD